MKKLVKLLAVCVMFVAALTCLTACSGASSVKTADYVKTYNQFLGDEYLEKTVTIGTEYWTDSEGRMGAYVENKDTNKVTLYVTSESEAVAFYIASKEDGKWVVKNVGNTLTFKIKPVSSSNGCNGNVSTYIIFGVLIAAVIGLFVWSSISNKKKQKKAQEAVRSLKVGDRVKTIGGICGFVAEIDDIENTFVLEIKAKDSSSFVKFDKGAIYQSAPANGNDATNKDAKVEEAKPEKKQATAKKTSAKKTDKK